MAAQPAMAIAVARAHRGAELRGKRVQTSGLREAGDWTCGEARQLTGGGLSAWPARCQRRCTRGRRQGAGELEVGDEVRGISVNRQSSRGSTIK